MNSVSIDIKNLLVDEQIGYFLGDVPPNPLALPFAISAHQEPTTPENVITIYDTGGPIISRTTDSNQIAQENFQIRVRALKYDTGYAKIEEIQDYLNAQGKTSAIGESYRMEGFYQQTAILNLGRTEDRKAFQLSLNYATLRIR